MGVMEAPARPEEEEIALTGEVPANLDQIGDDLYDKTIKDFINRQRQLGESLREDQELTVQIPREESSVADTIAVKELTFSRDKANRQFFATFKRAAGSEIEEHKTRDTTVALSVAAGLLVVGSLYWRHKK